MNANECKYTLESEWGHFDWAGFREVFVEEEIADFAEKRRPEQHQNGVFINLKSRR